MHSTVQDSFTLFQYAQDGIKLKKIYVDIAGDLIAGILLNQIIFWSLPTSPTFEDNIKIRVEKDNELWIAKGRNEWWNECRITPKQFDRAFKILEEKFLVQKKVFKFNGIPTMHIKLNYDQLIQHISNFTETPYA